MCMTFSGLTSLKKMKFKLDLNHLFVPTIAFSAISSISPPFTLAKSINPDKGSHCKWPNVPEKSPIHSQYCNTTLMTSDQCTLTNLMTAPITNKACDQKSSLILYNSSCAEIGRQDDIAIRKKDIELHSTLPKAVSIEEGRMGPGNSITFRYANFLGERDDFVCYSTGLDVNGQFIKACSAQFNCSAAAESAANVRGFSIGLIFVSLLVLVIAIIGNSVTKA
ncbi:hypothetical protein OCU04_003844 [Sclerotinia nivalis]|uniref:Uncharacterized protein n=1 Tax=Sclerotinia nivalis TaxID=352851 RepID=A0A9X0ASR6_9HELO|nr:hypothetical protein OCU04_003844 [Sclerotinia nivalis]